jgi:hypothetical protein
VSIGGQPDADAVCRQRSARKRRSAAADPSPRSRRAASAIPAVDKLSPRSVSSRPATAPPPARICRGPSLRSG